MIKDTIHFGGTGAVFEIRSPFYQTSKVVPFHYDIPKNSSKSK